jgi:hypothetical protein
LERSEKERTIFKALEKVAAEIGAKHIIYDIYLTFHEVATGIAYLMQTTPYVPILVECELSFFLSFVVISDSLIVFFHRAMVKRMLAYCATVPALMAP